MTRIAITYLLLSVTTSLYSWYLDMRHERTFIDPDVTVLEVIAGTFLCLLFARIALLHFEGAASDGWNITAGAFIFGGGPVVLWQAFRYFYRKGKRAAFKKKGLDSANKTDGITNKQETLTR